MNGNGGLRQFPPQIKYIVGNEACERFSYYGMRAILVIFMVQYLHMQESDSKGIYHLFVSANYFLPLFGAFLSDRYLGKFKTIIYLSIVYCIGHGVLALWENQTGLYAGLALIAIGAGGIKPCVSAHVGDQFNEKNSHLLEKVYSIFYFSINFGSFFSTMLIPWVLPTYGPGWAFGIPGILMALATVVFWMGKPYYVHVPPTGKEGGSKFWGILLHAITHMGDKRPGQKWLDTAREKFGNEKVDGAQAALDVFKVLVAISAFWALFEQHGSTWVLQAKQMDRNFLGWTLEAAQIPSLNPIMVMVLIPIFTLGIYPMVERMGIKVTPLRKMGAGMVMTTLSFLMAAAIQNALDQGQSISIGWQIPQYLVLTMAEVLVSITGLEFAYTQAPRSMKSTIMSLFLLTITIGNFLTAIVEFLNHFKGAAEFTFFASLMAVCSVIFIWGTTRYQYRSYVEKEGAFK